MKVYVIGSLRNPKVTEVAEKIRGLGFRVFDDWMAAGPEADDYWQQYEKARGHDFKQALQGHAAEHVYEYDRKHLVSSDIGVLVLPAGKSGHLELGFLIGRGKHCYILLDGEPERYDVMYKFADGIFTNVTDLLSVLNEHIESIQYKEDDELRKPEGSDLRSGETFVFEETIGFALLPSVVPDAAAKNVWRPGSGPPGNSGAC